MEQKNEQVSDGLLCTLVAMVNTNHGSWPITLTIGGCVITGSLIGIREYFDGVSSEFESVAKDSSTLSEEGTSPQKFFSDLGKLAFERWQEQEDKSEETGVRELPIHIHLKDAKFLFETKIVPKNVPLFWRGKIADVNGFCFGSLQTQE